jgi:hypothetical protein
MMMRMIQNIKYKAMLGNKFIKTILIIIGILSSIVTYSQPYKYNNNTSIVANSNNEGIYIKYTVPVIEETPAPADTITLPDPVAFYPFTGNAIDSSGNSHDGTVTNATLTTDRFEQANSAYSFTGSSDYITISEDASAFNFGAGGYTVSAWLYMEDGQTIEPISYNTSTSNGWRVQSILDGTPSTSLRLNSYDFISNKAAEWLNYAFVYKDDTIRQYINGVFRTEGTQTYTIAGAGSTLDFGRYVGKIDDVYLFDTVLSDLQIAYLSGNESALDAVQKGTVFHSDFEDQSLASEYFIQDPQYTEENSNLYVVANPDKDAVNNSNYVIMPVTRPTGGGETHSRAEYYSSFNHRYNTYQKKHTYQWMVYFPAGYLDNITIDGDWNLISQFVTHPCAWGQSGFETDICYSGGIFNEVRINSGDYGEYRFQFRAQPDCEIVPWSITEEQWIKLTLEIYWETDQTGYYSVWVDNTLIDNTTGVRTLPENYTTDESCGIAWKCGLYTSWTSATVDSVYYYVDNMEMYIDTSIEDVCPNCE